MSLWSFKIGGVEITSADAHSLAVELGQLEGSSLIRTQSGTAIKNVAWQKYTVRITGTGHYRPPALGGLDYSAPLEFVSPQPVAERVAVAASITTSRKFRQDDGYTPEVDAVLADGSRAARECTITTADTLAVTLEGDEEHLEVAYYPVLSVFFSPPSSPWDQYPARNGWTMSGEEV